MKTNERLLRQYIRESIRDRELLNEDTLKVGDLRAALNYTKGKKLKDAAAAVAKEAGKKGLGLAVDALASLVPGLGAVMDAIETGMELKDLYDAAANAKPEAKKTNPLWDRISIDPDAPAIVDDAIEAEFTDPLSDKVKYLDDEDELPDADVQLAGFLKSKFNQAHVAKGE
jgi:hypothetical protein